MNINELTLLREINNIEYAKKKYFFIGFIISFIPYLLVLLIASKAYVSNIFIYTIIILTVISCITNGFIVSNNIYKRLIEYFEFKYDTNYKEIKKSII